MHPVYPIILSILGDAEKSDLDIRTELNRDRDKAECYSKEFLRSILQGMMEAGLVFKECRPLEKTTLVITYYKKVGVEANITGLWSVPHLSFSTDDRLSATATIIVAATAEEAVEKWKKLAESRREYPYHWQKFSSSPLTAHPVRAYM